MNRLADSAAGLVNSYDHLDREPEIEVLSGKGDEGQKMGEFYERLAGVKTRHKSSTNSAAPGPTEETFAGLYGSVAEEDGDFLDRMFTGEEALGRYFDMNGLHAQYNNLPGVTRVSYLQFLDNFDAFAGIPRQRKLAGDKYKSYLEAVLEYLKDYSSRAYPLEDPEEVEEYAFERFEKAWRAKEVTSWQTDNSKQGGNTQGEEIWCEACEFITISSIQTETLNGLALRHAAGQKMYSKQTVYSAHLSSKKHVKAAELLKNGNGAKAASANGSAASTSSASKDKETERAHYLARLEAIISTLMRTTWLAPIRNDTKSNVERKAALTDKERMQELQDMEKREAEETKKAREEGSKRKKDAEELEVEEEKIYNPLKLPLGWDGKPIPFVRFRPLSVE